MRRLIPAVLITSLVTGFLSGSVFAQSADEKRAELEQVQKRLKALRQRLASDQKQESRATLKLRRTEQSITKVNQALRETRRQIAGKNRELEQLQARHGHVDRKLSAVQAGLSHQIRAAYQAASRGTLQVVLSHDDPAIAGRLLAYHHYLSQALVNGLAETGRQRDEVGRLQVEQEQQREQLVSLMSVRDRRQQKLKSERAERARTLAALKKDIARRHDEVGALEKSEKDLQALLRSLEQVFSDLGRQVDVRPFARRKGHLSWPGRGRILARYGQQRGIGRLKWRGVLIGAPAGAPVHAVAAGRVAFVDWLRGFGLLVILDHGDGYMSLYGFNQSTEVDEGAWIQGGDIIARVGDTGGQAAPGLYFELRKGARPLDPARWCAGRPKPLTTVSKRKN